MCAGKTHALIALNAELVLAGAAIPFTHGATVAAAGMALVVQSALAYGAGPLPDIDLFGSTVSRSMGFLTGALHDVVAKFGPHRTATHCLLGIAAFTASTEGGVLARHRWLPGGWGLAVQLAGSAWLCLLLAMVISSGLAILKAGGRKKGLARILGPERDWIALGIATVMVITGWGLSLAAVAIGIGMLAHLLADMATEEGCPVFYPFSERKFHLTWPAFLRFKQGGRFEREILYPAMLIALGYLVLIRLGMFPVPGAAELGKLTVF